MDEEAQRGEGEHGLEVPPGHLLHKVSYEGHGQTAHAPGDGVDDDAVAPVVCGQQLTRVDAHRDVHRLCGGGEEEVDKIDIITECTQIEERERERERQTER